MADPNTPDPTTPPPTAPPSNTAPDWVNEVKTMLEELPGRIKASVTDEDRNSIAESVHGLFEKGGAFAAPDPTPPDAPADTPDPGDPPPEKKQGLKGFASRFQGES